MVVELAISPCLLTHSVTRGVEVLYEHVPIKLRPFLDVNVVSVSH